MFNNHFSPKRWIGKQTAMHYNGTLRNTMRPPCALRWTVLVTIAWLARIYWMVKFRVFMMQRCNACGILCAPIQIKASRSVFCTWVWRRVQTPSHILLAITHQWWWWHHRRVSYVITCYYFVCYVIFDFTSCRVPWHTLYRILSIITCIVIRHALLMLSHYDIWISEICCHGVV